MEHGLPRLDECRARFARLIGADEDEIAVVPSISSGLSSVASCLAFAEKPTVVLSEMDFPTNHYVWRAQQRRGAKVDVVSSPDGTVVEPQEIADRIDDQTAVVNVNRVLFESSFIVDLEPIVTTARQHDALVVVDDFHGAGVVPIDVHSVGVDIYLAGALKWLCGGQGLAFLYCRRGLIQQLEPTVVGWFGTKDPFTFDRSDLHLRDDARRFETGTFALPQAWTAAGGLSIIEEVGVERIRSRNIELTTEIIRRADDVGLEVRSPRESERRGGLVRLQVPGGEAGAERVLAGLLERDVVVDKRADCLRISPHFFNDESDIERCFEAIVSALGKGN
jgi:selenocysteine lyase/cysteine desulfurase